MQPGWAKPGAPKRGDQLRGDVPSGEHGERDDPGEEDVHRDGGEGSARGHQRGAAGDERLEQETGEQLVRRLPSVLQRCSNGPAQAMPTPRARGTERKSTATIVAEDRVADDPHQHGAVVGDARCPTM